MNNHHPPKKKQKTVPLAHPSCIYPTDVGSVPSACSGEVSTVVDKMEGKVERDRKQRGKGHVSGVTLTPFFCYLSLLAPSQPCFPDLAASGRCHHPAHHVWSPTPVGTPAGPLSPSQPSARGPITSASDYVTSLLRTHLRPLIPARKHTQVPTMTSKSLRGWPL